MTRNEYNYISASVVSDGSHDFDFLHGTWKVRHRRLRERLVGSNSWEEFGGTSIETPLWGGIANMEEVIAHTPRGTLEGLALRLYNPITGEWTIHWSTSSVGILDAPMIGRFGGGSGEFYGQDQSAGPTVFVRFIWTPQSANSCRWEQAFSADGGHMWETNWIMDFTRSV